MADRMTAAQRSFTMSRIRSQRNRSTEIRLVRELRRRRITGWRRNSALAGKPDLVFSKTRVVVFVDGCFWHGCPRCFALPKSNIDYWRGKIVGNQARDTTVRAALRGRGWRVVRIWEHSLKINAPGAVARLIGQLPGRAAVRIHRAARTSPKVAAE